MKIIDLSQKLYDAMPVYPGDPEVEIKQVHTLAGEGWNLRTLLLTTHLGTHVNVPIHMTEDGDNLDYDILPIMKMKSFSQFKAEALKDSRVRKVYDQLQPEYDLISSLIHKRIKCGLSQAELARKIGTKQSAISRLESGNTNPSLAFLKKVAKGLDARLKFTFT